MTTCLVVADIQPRKGNKPYDKRWTITIGAESLHEEYVSVLRGPCLDVDYQPGRSLDIKVKNGQRLLALSDASPLLCDLSTKKCFPKTKNGMAFLQTALVRYVRFVVWAFCERGNYASEQQSGIARIYADYLLLGSEVTPKDGGTEIRFSINNLEAELLLSLLRPVDKDPEVAAVKEFDRRRWGIRGTD